jgi:hypothetical protein
MSYLVQYLPRTCAPVRPLRALADEQILLNHPGYHAGAYVRVYVEDTLRRRVRRGRIPSPRFAFEIADCTSSIYLEFDVETAGSRENSLFKISTLIGSLERFQVGLQAEAELRAAREGARTPTAVQRPPAQPSRGGQAYLSTSRRADLRSRRRSQPTQMQLGRRLHVVGRRLGQLVDSRPRLRGAPRQADAHACERGRGGTLLAVDGIRAVSTIVEVASTARRRRTTRRCSHWRCRRSR